MTILVERGNDGKRAGDRQVDGRQIGSVWIALDDMPLEASVRYVQGSHAASQVKHL